MFTGPNPNVKVPGVYYAPGDPLGTWENLGYLYPGKYIGDGKTLFCPSFSISSDLSIYQYSVPNFMSTCGPLSPNPLMNPNTVRSSILFNPRVVASTNGANLYRAYQKTSTTAGHKLFAMDYLEGPGGAPGGIKFNADGFCHYPSKGWVVLFTDGAASFCASPTAFNVAINTAFTTEETDASRNQYNAIFDMLEIAESKK